MNGIIKYLLYLLIALLLISWIITVGKSCNKPKNEVGQTDIYEITESQSSEGEETVSFDEEMENILNEEEAAAEDIVGDQEKELESIVAEEDLDYSSYDPKKDVVEEKKEVAPAQRPAPAPQKKPVASSSGRYMVVAGSYIHPDNAKKQKNKLSNMGYPAEVVVFDLSQYHTVLAGRYSDYASAQRAADRLDAKGLDCYVKKQTF